MRDEETLERPSPAFPRWSVGTMKSAIKHPVSPTTGSATSIQYPVLGAVVGCVLTLMVFFVPLACAEQLTLNSYEDGFPHIKGHFLVWQGYLDGDWEIFLYDIAQGKNPVQITDNDFDDISPQTDGEFVVWLGYNGIGGEVMFYSKETGIAQITNDTRLDSPPKIADGRVVWAASEVTDSVSPGEIFLYDTGLKTTRALTADGFDDRSPRINGNVIAWVRADQQVNHLLLYELGTDNITVDPPGFVWEDDTRRDGDFEVLSRFDGNDNEIFIRNLALGTYDPLTRNAIEDSHPQISGDYVAWVGGTGAEAEIFLSGQNTEADLEETASDAPAETETPIDSSGDESPIDGVPPTGGGSGGGGGGCFIGAAALHPYLAFPLQLLSTWLSHHFM